MTRTFVRSLALAASLALSVAAAGAESVGTTAAQFLRLPVGARAAALGGSYVALADDVWALHYNPGGLGLVRRGEAAAMYERRFVDVDVSQLGVVAPMGGGSWALGGSLLYLGSKDERRAAPGNVIGTFAVEDLALTAAAGTTWHGVGMGAVVRYIGSTIDDQSASAIAADLGLLWRWSDDLSFGAAVQHLGSRLRYARTADPLPRTVRFGAAGRFFEERLLVSGEAIFVRDLDAQGAVGAEIRLARPLVVRAGLRLHDNLGIGDRVTVGLGLRFPRIDLDYAYSPYGYLGEGHLVSLAYGWGEEGRVAVEEPPTVRPSRRPILARAEPSPAERPSSPPPAAAPAAARPSPAPAPPSPPPTAASPEPVPAPPPAVPAASVPPSAPMRVAPPAPVPPPPAPAVAPVVPQGYLPPMAPEAEFVVETVRGAVDRGLLEPAIAEGIRAGGRRASLAPAPSARFRVEPVLELFSRERIRLSAVVGDRREGGYRLVMIEAANQLDAARALGRRIAAQ